MSTNVGALDRFVRLSLSALLLYLGLVTYSGSTIGLGLAIASTIPALTAIFGVCPVYSLLGIKTCKLRQSPRS